MADLLLAVVVIAVAVAGAELVRLVCRRQLTAPALVREALGMTGDTATPAAPLRAVPAPVESEAA